MHAPAIRIVPLVDDEELRNVTGELIASPPDIVVVTTGIGFRGWVEAAHGWDVADGLIEALGSTRILARAPKRVAPFGRPACVNSGARNESSAEVLDKLLAEGVDGSRIAVQLHARQPNGEPDTDICDALTAAGAEVIRVPVYRWELPAICAEWTS